jgi:two-component system nitrate/nitrite response regulator NarL
MTVGYDADSPPPVTGKCDAEGPPPVTAGYEGQGLPAMSDSPSVVIADDHPAIRLGVRMALLRDGMRVLAEAADRDGTVRAVVRERPDICLLDIQMPGGGIETAATLAAMAPETAVVMLTVSTSTTHLLAALRAGAVGYLPKDAPTDQLPGALRGVLAGEPALPRAFLGPVLGELRTPRRARGASPRLTRSASRGRHTERDLTAREAEIMQMLSSGLGTAQVGEALGVSPVTIRRHVSSAVAKLGVADRHEAVRALTA